MILDHSRLSRSAALLLALGTAMDAAQAGRPLNDTGMTQCIVNKQLTKECVGTGQDAEFGRDVTKKNKNDGAKGFAYAKVCNSGEVAGSGTCPADPALGAGANEWACTLDKVSNLIWEVKTKSGLRSWKTSYTSVGDGRPGDSSEFVAQVNAQGLCGANDWKLPTQVQLQGLVHYGVALPGPAIDKNWFPYTSGAENPPEGLGEYLTADAYAAYPSYTWVVFFQFGGVGVGGAGRVRLVRAAQ